MLFVEDSECTETFKVKGKIVLDTFLQNTDVELLPVLY